MVPELSYHTNSKSAIWKRHVLNTSNPFRRPQGSILGPLLFVLYINDLPQCLENCSINMYADDTVMYFTNLCTSEIARVVQDDLNGVVQSMKSSRLILNQSKTKSMLFRSWKNLAKSPNVCIQFYRKTLERVAEFSYLGVVLDETLSWKDHVEYVSSKVCRRLGLLSRIRSCLTLEASKQYTHHSCSHYLTMLMLRGGKSQRGVAKSYTAYRTVQLEFYYGRTPQMKLSVC